ncbi:MAG: iron-containing redox enzyme family protein [Actinomycetota bacterium]|nr:iron-containing redox enzyme family protein [Actinomycetota bacterium]
MGINTIIIKRHLLTHPFYVRWQQGKVPMDTLQEYAKQYYHYESALPGLLRCAMEHMEEGPAREAVAEVLADESSYPTAHTDMWLDFAAGLGLDRADVEVCRASPRTVNLVETYTSLCARGADEALAALYAYEAQLPEVAKAKSDGLRRFYGVTDESALAFFDLHSTLDVEHARALKSALRESELSRESAHLAMDAWWGMLDQFC